MCIAWLRVWEIQSPYRDSQEVGRYWEWGTQVSVGISEIFGEIRYFVCRKTAYISSPRHTVINDVSSQAPKLKRRRPDGERNVRYRRVVESLRTSNLDGDDTIA